MIKGYQTATLIFGLAACTSVKSSSIVTGALTPEFTATSEDGQINVSAQFRVDGLSSNTFVELAEGDKIKAIYGEQEKVLDESSFGSMYTYQSTFDTTEGSQEVRFVLERADGTLLQENLVPLPELFDLASPSTSTVLSRSDELNIQWRSNDSEDPVTIRIEGSCIWSHEDVVPISQGAYPLPVYSLRFHQPMLEGESCDINISLERRVEGTIDPGFEEGRSYGAQQQSRTVTIQN